MKTRPRDPSLGAVALALLGVASCVSTAGVPVGVRLAIEPTGAGASTTPTGWRVVLEEARVLLGPLYAYAPEHDAMAWLAPLGASRARAHGGFDPLGGRLVRFEHLDQIAFDALGGRVDVAIARGLRGAVDEVSVVLDAPRGANAALDGPTRGHHLSVRGVATRGGERVDFEGGLDLEEAGIVRRVDGIGVEGPPLDEGSTLLLRVDPARWFAEADFTGLASPVVLTPSLQPHRAWRLGARSSGAYSAQVLHQLPDGRE